MAMEQTKFELTHLQQDINDIKASLTAMMESLQRLAALEERFTTVAHQISTLQRQFESLDDRMRKLENEHIYAKASAKTLATTGRVAWALGGGLVMTLLSKILNLVA